MIAESTVGLFQIPLRVRRRLAGNTTVQRLISTVLRGRAMQLHRVRGSGTPYVNVGCGAYARPDFVNLDYTWYPGVQLCWDITAGLPFSDASLAGIFTEHCLEHISYEQCRGVLAEFHRILQSEATVRS